MIAENDLAFVFLAVALLSALLPVTLKIELYVPWFRPFMVFSVVSLVYVFKDLPGSLVFSVAYTIIVLLTVIVLGGWPFTDVLNLQAARYHWWRLQKRSESHGGELLAQTAIAQPPTADAPVAQDVPCQPLPSALTQTTEKAMAAFAPAHGQCDMPTQSLGDGDDVDLQDIEFKPNVLEPEPSQELQRSPVKTSGVVAKQTQSPIDSDLILEARRRLLLSLINLSERQSILEQEMNEDKHDNASVQDRISIVSQETVQATFFMQNLASFADAARAYSVCCARLETGRPHGFVATISNEDRQKMEQWHFVAGHPPPPYPTAAQMEAPAGMAALCDEVVSYIYRRFALTHWAETYATAEPPLVTSPVSTSDDLQESTMQIATSSLLGDRQEHTTRRFGDTLRAAFTRRHVHDSNVASSDMTRSGDAVTSQLGQSSVNSPARPLTNIADNLPPSAFSPARPSLPQSPLRQSFDLAPVANSTPPALHESMLLPPSHLRFHETNMAALLSDGTADSDALSPSEDALSVGALEGSACVPAPGPSSFPSGSLILTHERTTIENERSATEDSESGPFGLTYERRSDDDAGSSDDYGEQLCPGVVVPRPPDREEIQANAELLQMQMRESIQLRRNQISNASLERIAAGLESVIAATQPPEGGEYVYGAVDKAVPTDLPQIDLPPSLVKAASIFTQDYVATHIRPHMTINDGQVHAHVSSVMPSVHDPFSAHQGSAKRSHVLRALIGDDAPPSTESARRYTSFIGQGMPSMSPRSSAIVSHMQIMDELRFDSTGDSEDFSNEWGAYEKYFRMPRHLFDRFDVARAHAQEGESSAELLVELSAREAQGVLEKVYTEQKAINSIIGASSALLLPSANVKDPGQRIFSVSNPDCLARVRGAASNYDDPDDTVKDTLHYQSQIRSAAQDTHKYSIIMPSAAGALEIPETPSVMADSRDDLMLMMLPDAHAGSDIRALSVLLTELNGEEINMLMDAACVLGQKINFQDGVPLFITHMTLAGHTEEALQALRLLQCQGVPQRFRERLESGLQTGKQIEVSATMREGGERGLWETIGTFPALLDECHDFDMLRAALHAKLESARRHTGVAHYWPRELRYINDGLLFRRSLPFLEEAASYQQRIRSFMNQLMSIAQRTPGQVQTVWRDSPKMAAHFAAIDDEIRRIDSFQDEHVLEQLKALLPVCPPRLRRMRSFIAGYKRFAARFEWFLRTTPVVVLSTLIFLFVLFMATSAGDYFGLSIFGQPLAIAPAADRASLGTVAAVNAEFVLLALTVAGFCLAPQQRSLAIYMLLQEAFRAVRCMLLRRCHRPAFPDSSPVLLTLPPGYFQSFWRSSVFWIVVGFACGLGLRLHEQQSFVLSLAGASMRGLFLHLPLVVIFFGVIYQLIFGWTNGAAFIDRLYLDGVFLQPAIAHCGFNGDYNDRTDVIMSVDDGLEALPDTIADRKYLVRFYRWHKWGAVPLFGSCVASLRHLWLLFATRGRVRHIVAIICTVLALSFCIRSAYFGGQVCLTFVLYLLAALSYAMTFAVESPLLVLLAADVGALVCGWIK